MAQAKKLTTDYRTLSQELDAIVTELQREDLDVDEALAHYKRGLQLAEELETYLKSAENTVTELKTRFNTTK